MTKSYWSRLTIVGDYVLESPLRIGTSTDSVALDSAGHPYVPGSSFRGALRAYVESALRGIEDDRHSTRQSVTLRGPDGRAAPVSRIVKLCCESVDKRDDDLNYQGCLNRAIVARWESDPVLRPKLDEALVNCSCQVCRLFGAPWLAGRVFIPDLPVAEWSGSFVARGGLALNRDRDVAIEGSAFQRQAVPPGTRFTFQLHAENVAPVEQGILMLGLRAFEAGFVSLGADRARGLGRGRLAIDWWNCRYIDADNFIDAMLGGEQPPFTDSDAEARLNALAAELNKP